MKYLIFDTETTGLPIKNANWKTDYMDFPYIVQISWKFLNEQQINNFIIRPNKWEIPDEASWIHGITTQIAEKEGINLEPVLLYFLKDCLISDKLIGHNIYFDTSMVKANFMKINNGPTDEIDFALDKSKRMDTMLKSIKFCNIKNGNKLKYPTLQELYFKLFNETFEAHNSKNDILATERCFNKLVELNIIKF